jgi:hypothetical protein
MTKKYENETSDLISRATEWLECTKMKLLALFLEQFNDYKFINKISAMKFRI